MMFHLNVVTSIDSLTMHVILAHQLSPFITAYIHTAFTTYRASFRQVQGRRKPSRADFYPRRRKLSLIASVKLSQLVKFHEYYLVLQQTRTIRRLSEMVDSTFRSFQIKVAPVCLSPRIPKCVSSLSAIGMKSGRNKRALSRLSALRKVTLHTFQQES